MLPYIKNISVTIGPTHNKAPGNYLPKCSLHYVN